MKRRRDFEPLGVLAIALALTLPAWLPLLADAGLVSTRAGGDSPFLLQRVHQMSVALRAGHIPARWMPDAAFGHGYPFWNYYAPLVYYASAAFHLLGLGIVNAIKLTQISGFVVAAVGMYVFALDVFNRRAAALLAAAAYTYAPFHLVNVYVRGDSLSEFWAFALYPLVFLGIRRLRVQPGPGTTVFGALAYGSLILTHNISALIATPVAAAYALLLLLARPSRGRRDEATTGPYLLWSTAAFGTGLLISGWYWAPALLERAAVQLESNLTGYFHYAGHFRSLSPAATEPSLIQPYWLFDYTIGNAATPFVMGAAQALVLLAGCVALVFLVLRREHSPSTRDLGFFVGASIVVTLLITPWSEPFWARMPLLPFVQFPWRWLSVQAFAVSVVAGGLVPAMAAAVPAAIPAHWVRWTTAIGVSLLLTASAMSRLDVDYLPVRASDITAENFMLYEMFTGNIGSTVRAEYLPNAVRPRPWTSERLATGRPAIPLGAQDTQRLTSELAEQQWQTTVDEGRDVVFPTYWFPGWQASIDGNPVATSAQPEHGGIRVSVPQGTHTIRLVLGRTPIRAGAELASLVGIVLLLGLVLQHGLGRRHLRIGGLTAAALLAGGVLLAVAAASTGAPDGPISMDYSTMPYPHPNPSGLKVGTDARLAAYTFSSSEANAGQIWTLDLTWAELPSGAEVEAALVSPAEVLFDVPAAVATADAAPASSMSLKFDVPTRASPGVYLPRLVVGQQDGEAAAYLRPIRIVGRVPRPIDGPPVGDHPLAPASVGSVASVAIAQAVQPTPDELAVELIWWPEQERPANYVTSLRLKAPTGHTVAHVDAQPCYGFCPTSSWRVGQPVYDRRWLEVPSGTGPGSDYSLEVVVYHVEDLAPVGATRLPDIVLTETWVETELDPLYTFDSGPAVVLLRTQDFAADPREPPQQVQAGGVVNVEVGWWLPPSGVGMSAARILLIDVSNGQIAQSQPAPLPTDVPAWAYVRRHYTLTVPPDLRPGRYRVALDLGNADDRFTSELTIEVVSVNRQFETPTLETPLTVDFGRRLRLLGYDLKHDRGSVILRVAWRALADIDEDFAVFVHLLDPDSGDIVAQADRQPAAMARPTSTWIADEVVVHEFHLETATIPTGVYQLGLGWYEPDSWERLPALDGTGQRLPDDRVVLQDEVNIRHD